MHHVMTHILLNIIMSTTMMFFPFLNSTWGDASGGGERTNADLTLVNGTAPDQQPFVEEARQHLHKSRELLNDLQTLRDQTTSKEKKQDLYAPIMKLTKELEHAERLSKNLDVIDPESWLRTKTEVEAGMADLQVAYDEAFPLLQDRTRSLEEAVRHAQSAMELGKEGPAQLFLQKTRSAKYYASLAQQQGMSSRFLKEGISELEDALFHIEQNNIGAAATLTEGAFLHLNSALNQRTSME